MCCLPFASVLPFHLPFPRRLRPCPSVSGNNNNKINKVKNTKEKTSDRCVLSSFGLSPPRSHFASFRVIYITARIVKAIYRIYTHVSRACPEPRGQPQEPAPEIVPGPAPGSQDQPQDKPRDQPRISPRTSPRISPRISPPAPGVVPLAPGPAPGAAP